MAVRNISLFSRIFRSPDDGGGSGGGDKPAADDAPIPSGLPGQGEGSKIEDKSTPIADDGDDGEQGFASDAAADDADGADKGGDEAFADPDGEAENGDADGKNDPDAEGADGKKSDDDGDEDGDAASDKEGKKSTNAPETYEDFTLPDGADADQDMMAEYMAECKGLDLSQEQAQTRLDGMLAWKEKSDKQALAYWQEQAATWTQAAKDQGVMTSEMRQRAAAGLRLADNIELEGGEQSTTSVGKVLSQMGLDKNPAILRAFAAYHELHGDETDIAQAGQTGGAELTADEKLYGRGVPT